MNLAETALLSKEADKTGHGTQTPAPSISLSENLTIQAASDGADEAAVLKTLKSRTATSVFDTPSQVVIAAHENEDMLDTSNEPHEVPVHGTYYNKFWTSGNSGSKATNGDMRIARQYVRASRLFIPRNGAKHMPNRLPVEVPDPESATPAVYVCISRVSIRHVFMRDKTKVNNVSYADNTESFDFRAEPSNVVAGINTIFHNNRVLQNLPVEPVQNLKVSDDAGRQASHATLYHRNGIDTYWMYHATTLEIVKSPKELFDRLSVFLSIHPLNSIPTNPAVHVVCLYFMAKNSASLESEEFFEAGTANANS
ncbi:hypothetical protein F52700_10442 [Fusarium sp. NRRL 52700]|nr:hypothetical protein F52700_10442 [Fusarium sp. NRRL 52700]